MRAEQLAVEARYLAERERKRAEEERRRAEAAMNRLEKYSANQEDGGVSSQSAPDTEQGIDNKDAT